MVNPKDVVLSVMTVDRCETKTVTENGKETERKFVTYRCPKPACTVKTITIKDGSGYSNPYSHLRSCYGNGKTLAEQDEILRKMYTVARQTAKDCGGEIALHFQKSSLSEYEKAVYHYIRLIVLRRYPISCVIDPELRAISKFTSVLDTKTIRAVLISLVLLVEDRMKEALEGKKGALLFDGWTENGTHYVAMLVSYVDIVKSLVAGHEVPQPVTRLALLAASPMAQVSGADDDPSDDESSSGDVAGKSEGSEVTKKGKETISFNATTHLSFFRDNFQFFGQDFNDWCVCLISDNCKTNMKIASDCGKPMIGCYSHKLNLEVNRMINSTSDLDETLESIHDTMSAAKSRLKNKTMLRNLVARAPVLPNETRWSGKCDMVTRFVEIRPELIAVSQRDKCDLPIDSTNVFAEKAEKYAAQLKEINSVTKELQKRAMSLRDCRVELNDLYDVIADSAEAPNAPLHNCTLGQHYTGMSSHLVTDPLFESAVIKLQGNCLQDLTDDEKKAVECLQLNTGEGAAGNGAEGGAEVLSMSERRKKRRKTEAIPKRYMHCNFILGSVAEVERVWSVAKHLLGDVRHRLSPIMLEALLFLRFNERFWDDQLVAQAISNARAERTNKRVREVQAEMDALNLHDAETDEQ